MPERPDDGPRGDMLDRGLAAAFGPGPASRGALATLGDTIGPVPRVLLRDTDFGFDAPLVKPASPEVPDGPGRYQLFGEIARGGMGAVLKGRDIDLGRDLAVKVLLEQHRNRPELVRRFVEEAQIGGQLQHPGIVPVYELGTFPDCRPYFAMKLVKGRTLAALLDARSKPSDDHARFLGIFEQVAQTVAYAHARGVIHRDLKPSNVMVGAFGEVQVMDWGLAKVLKEGGVADDERSRPPQNEVSVVRTVRSGSAVDDSQAGSVLGTPAYMAPEQATGDLDAVDERADVFGLGSILCEVLTGRPAYTGRTGHEVHRKAARGDTADALARLESSGADPDLRALANRCLAVEPLDRPRDAGQVSEAVATYQNSVIERLRRAEVERAAEQVRAVEERRRRRVTLALAASMLTVAALSIAFAVSQSRSNAKLTTAYVDLSHEQGRTQTALDNTQRLAAELALDKGRFLGEQGDANSALLWMARGLKLAPADAVELQAVARSNLGYWRTRINPLRAILRFDAEVWAVAFMPGGKTILTGNPNGAFQLWNATSGERIGARIDKPVSKRIGKPFPRSGAQTFAIAFSPDGKSVLTGGADSTAQLRDIATSTEIWNQDVGGWIRTAAFSSEGRLLFGIVGSEREWAQLWSVATGKPLSPPLEHRDLVLAVAFSPDGKTFVTESGMPDRGPGVARFWDADGKEIRKPLEQPSAALGLAFSPDGKKLLTGHFDGNARLWELSTDQVLLTLPHEALVRGVAFSLDGRTFVTVSYDSTARLWETATGKPLGPPLRHGDMVKSVTFSPDGTTLLTLAADKTARIWEVAANSSVTADLPHDEPLFPLSFSTDRQTIMTRDVHNSARLRNAVSGKLIGEPLRHELRVTAGAFSPNHKTAVTVEEKTTAGPWDITTTRLWNVATGKPIGPPLDHPAVNAVAYSPDGKTAVTGGSGGARLWDATTGASTKTEPFSRSNRVYAVAFSPDGKTILTGDAGFKARLWDDAGDERIVEPIKHTNMILAVAFSCDGKTILTGSTDNTARLWEAATGKQIGPPLTHQGRVNAVAFSLDGRTVLTGSRDTTARLWDVATGKPIGPPLPHSGPVQRVAFWYDGKTVLTAGEDKIAHFWQLSPPVEGDAEQLELWSQVVTGMELEVNGAVRVLESTTWQQRRLKLKDLGFRLP